MHRVDKGLPDHADRGALHDRGHFSHPQGVKQVVGRKDHRSTSRTEGGSPASSPRRDDLFMVPENLIPQGDKLEGGARGMFGIF